MILIYLPPVLFSVLFLGMCTFYHITYLSQQGVLQQMSIACLPVLIILSAIQVIRFGPGIVDKSARDKIEASLYNQIQEELKSLLLDEEKLLETLAQSQTNPGSQEEQIIRHINVELQEKTGIKICKYCQSYKPARSHHCRQCRECIFRMDHHCQWLGVCIGQLNYKYFMTLIFYLNIALIVVLITYFKPYLLSIDENDISLVCKFTFYHGAFMLLLLFLPFFLHHLRLAMHNQTTIEFYEKKGKINYDKGIWQNLKEMIDEKWYFWLIPI